LPDVVLNGVVNDPVVSARLPASIAWRLLSRN
jgi:hypothetical protein